MVMTKPLAESIRLADMGRQEAEEVTQAIKDNFDSLGAMLSQARDRKAYKALGYRSFESYCQSEFGKSVSSAYQLIEDARVIAELETKISENYGEEVTLKLPASHLRPLKQVEDIEDKLKVIERAQKLAAAEGKKPTKKHLDLAVFQVQGKRSEDLKKAIEGLGFTKGTSVEVQSPIKKDRGVITRIDKSGKIYVELYYFSARSMPFNPEELRILSKEEKPSNPLESSVASKGDRVLIFAKGLEGQKGTIFTWNESKQALVIVDGQNSPTSIAYAEMELISEKKDSIWEVECVWNSGKNTYYYFPKEDSIYSNRWPTGLTLKPYTHSGTPIEFVENWENRFSERVLESLATPAKIKTLALAQAIELPKAEGNEFVADLISSLLQSFPDVIEPLSQKALGISFARTIDELISGKKTQTRRAWQDDYAKNFIRYFNENIPIPALNKGRYRGGHELGFIRLTQRPYQQYLSEMTATDLQEEGGMVATTQEFINTFFEGQDKLVWVLHFEFLPTRSSDTEVLVKENERLREQLTETEAAIQAMMTAVSTSPVPGDTATTEETPTLKLEADRDDLLIRLREAQNKYISIRKLEVEPLEDRINNLESALTTTEKELKATQKELELTIDHSKQGFYQQEISKIALVNETLQSRLAEAEATIKAMVQAYNAAEASAPGDTAAHSEFLAENVAETSAPGDTEEARAIATESIDSWKQILEANHFISVPYNPDELPEYFIKNIWFKGSYRDWEIFFDEPNGQIIAISFINAKGEMFSRCTEVNFDIDLNNEDKMIEWARGVINQVEDFCPGQLSLFSIPDVVSVSREIEIEENLPAEILERLEIEKDKAQKRLDENQAKKHELHGGHTHKKNRKEIERLDRNTADQEAKLEQLESFSQFRIGQTICHKRDPLILGKIIKLEFSQGGMPLVWVRYYRDGELEKTPNSELVSMIFIVDVE